VTRLKGAAPELVGGGDHRLLHNLLLDLVSSLMIFLCVFRLIQWNPALATTTTPAMASDSSGSSSRFYSSRSSGGDSRYSDRDTRRFKEERDATRHELEIISEQVGIAELEWQH
jgi:hypothetical protein